MKFYGHCCHADQAAGDVYFPSRREAEAEARTIYGKDWRDQVEIRVLEHKGPLTKSAVCSMLTHWPLR